MLKSAISRFLLPAAVLLMLVASLLGFISRRSISEIAKSTAQKIVKKAILFRDFDPGAESREYRKIYREEKIGLYTFHSDSLVAWNNSRIPFHEQFRAFQGVLGFVKLKHGYYYF